MPSSHAIVRLSSPVAVRDRLCAHLAHHDVSISDEAEGLVVARLTGAQARISASDDALAFDADASSDERLEELIAFLASHVREFAHPERPEIAWSGIAASRLVADFREMTVTGVEDLSPHMRRVRLAGDDLDRFASDGDLHVRLFFPPDGAEPAWPTRGPDGLTQPVAPERKPLVRKYTIRRIDAPAGWVEIDFVIYEVAGPGSDWAAAARPGKVVGMAGPGGRTAKPADWMLLAGDETALPAIARICETLPDSTAGQIMVEIASAGERIAIVHPAGMRLTWIDRSAGGLLLDAVKGVIPPKGSRFCWAGAEFEQIQAIRSYWREDCGLSKDEQLAVAYWRKGRPLD